MKTKLDNSDKLLLPDRHYSVPQVASVIGVAAITCWRAIYAGHLATNRIGRRRVVSGAQVQEWIAAGGQTSVSKGGR